jgi:hypothetical protein
VIDKGDFEEMRWGRDYLRFLRKDLGGFLFFLWRFWENIEEVLEGNDGEVVGMRFVDLRLEGNTKIIRCAMYLERQSIYLRTRYDGWERGMMRNSRGLESGQQLFSIVCVCVLFIFGFCCLAFQKRVPWFWELQRIASIHWIFKVNHKRDGCSFLYGFLK